MAKQTINIGASPNDGTGTPLRTSFDYTNQNFTELYTALGGGVGLPGATTQVIFNDGGTNLAGDAGLVYNKTTDALTVAGLVTAGSATITGALGAAGLNVTGATIPANGVYLGSANNLSFSAASALGMTLNSTGLGVGVASPSSKFHVDAGASSEYFRGAGNSGAARALVISASTTTNAGDTHTFNAGSVTGVLAFATGGTVRATVDAAGNCGIGVTPSAWRSNYRAIEIGRAGSGFWSQTDSSRVGMSANTYISSSGQFIYSDTSAATYYNQFSGQHQWFTAPSFTAGTAISFTQAMTLDASGRLLVGPTSANASGGILQLSSGITFPATQVASSDANTLDDYEEGTWTGTLKGSVSDPTIAVTATGRYTKIGRVVTVRIAFESVITTGASGNCYITGLPFANASIRTPGSAGSFIAMTFTGSLFSSVDPSLSQIDFLANNSNGNWVQATHNPGTGRTINAQLTYSV